MALSNSQYNAVMRGYEERRRKSLNEREARAAEVYGRLPELRRLDQEAAGLSADRARSRLGAGEAAESVLRAELADLRGRRDALLREAGYPSDYLEPRYVCPVCQDTGYADGRPCACFKRERLAVLYAQSGIRRVLERENFGSFSFAYYDRENPLPQLGVTQAAYMERVADFCRSFADEYPKHGKNLLFTGSTGVGKTFLANCIAKALLDQGVPVVYLTAHDLFERFSRSRFGRDGGEDGAGEELLDCEMLIIDDLGTEVNNTFVTSELFSCLNGRLAKERGTIISTNLSLALLRDAYTDRVASRIAGSYRSIPLYGADLRLKLRAKRG